MSYHPCITCDFSLLAVRSSTDLAGRPSINEKQDDEEGISWTDQEFAFRNNKCLLIQHINRFTPVG